MNNLGWTTLEQSKKLVEAGLTPTTSDMTYRRYKAKGKYEWLPEHVPYSHWLTKDEDGCSMDLDIVKPCWSLGALINLMQPFYPAIEYEGNDLWNISICAISYLFSDNEGYDIHIKEKLLVDACVKTIIVLIEHNKIKQEETK